MGCREGMNLFSKWGRKVFWRRFPKYIEWNLVYIDTFAPLICKILGHIPYFSEEVLHDRFGRYEHLKVCKRCQHYLDF
jgi:hypothetical protein